MEFDLDQLNRDWIEGISGEAFAAKVQTAANILGALTDQGRSRGLLLADTDPIEFASGFFGAVLTETPIILANPKWGDKEWAEMNELVQPGIVFSSVGVPPLGGHGSAGRLKAGLQPGSILIPTGGTTGGVKLAIHTWDSLVAASRGVQAFLGGGAIDSCCVLPLYHVSGLMQLLRSFISGGTIRFDEDEVAGRCLSYVPTQLQRALTSEECIQKLTTARAIFVGGAGMPESLAQQARDRQLPIIPVYGMTETAAMCAAIPNDVFLKGPQAGAVPLGEAQFAIKNGQIGVQTPALFQGYQGRAPVDLSRGYLTGDAGRLDGDGRLHVLGRMDRLINTGGEKVDPHEVEAALLQIEGIDEAQVTGEPDPEWGQIVVAQLHSPRELDLEEVRGQLKTKLSPYKIPKRFEQNVGATLVPPAAAKPAGSQSPAGGTSVAPTENSLPIRKTHNLYRGRCSIPSARYFITLCTKDRRHGLTDSSVAESILVAWRLQHTDRDYVFHCGTVMPDHIHCLFTLSDRLSLGQCIKKFKAKTKVALTAAGLEWQRDFYDHHLRAEDGMERFARYIFLNPYRKSLLSTDQAWPHWHLSSDYRPEFIEHMNANGGPPHEWLGAAPNVEDLVDLDCQAESS